ncbi:MAG: class I SAM-dependent methyltransferase [Candidatus Izemoplasmatales bacterium]
MKTHNCVLCNHKTIYFTTFRNKTYNHCPNCDSVQMLPEFFISSKDEKNRYELHKDGTNDLGYLNFIKPITSYILNNLDKKNIGLDFGAGHSPVISSVLEKNGFKIFNYDPYFHNNEELLKDKYDFITSCEVIEHFYNPQKEFQTLSSLLRANGKLVLMTDLYDSNTDFNKWYYKNDETHVFFYSKKSFEYIKKRFGFKSLDIDNRLVVLSK